MHAGADETAIYESRGLSAQTAAQVARELTAHDPLAAHASAELKIDPDNLATLGRRRRRHRRPRSVLARCYRHARLQHYGNALHVSEPRIVTKPEAAALVERRWRFIVAKAPFSEALILHAAKHSQDNLRSA